LRIGACEARPATAKCGGKKTAQRRLRRLRFFGARTAERR